MENNIPTAAPGKKKDENNDPSKKIEKKVFKAGIINIDELAAAQSRDIADARMTESKEDLSGSRTKRFFKRIWKHNLAQDYYRNKEVEKVRQQILDSGNLYEGEKEYGEEGHADAEHNKNAMKGIVDRFTSEFADEILREEEIDSKRKGNAVINNQIKELIKSYAASNTMSEEAFKAEKDRLILSHNPNYSNKESLYADNLFDIAKEVKDSIAHGQALQDMDFDVELTLGKARESLNSEASKTAFDKIMEWSGKNKFRTAVFNTLGGGAVAGAYFAIKNLGKSLTKNTAKWLAFGGGLVVGGAFEANKESVRTRRERTQHMREKVKGAKFDADIERRNEMDKTAYETKSATEIKSTLDNSLALLKRGNLTDAEADQIMGELADFQARIDLGEKNKIDLVSYESFDKVESDRTAILEKAAMLKVALRNSTSPRHANFDANFRTLTNTLLGDLEEGEVSEKDAVYRKLKAKRVAKAFVKGVVGGAIFSFATQEVTSLFTNEDGLIEGTVKGVHNHFTGPENDMHVSNTATTMESARRFLFGGGPRMPMGVGHEEIIGDNIHTHLPDGVDLTENPDGSYNLMHNGDVVVKDLTIDPATNQLTPESLAALRAADINTSASFVGENTTETVTKSATEYMRDHQELGTHISRDWMGNDTPMYEDPNNPGHLLGADYNELRAQWGGVNGTGFNENGDAVFNVKHMLNDGSWRDNISVAAHDQMENKNLFLLLSVTKDGQMFPIKIPIDEFGNGVIPHDSAAFQMMIEKASNGHAVFTGAYAEIGNLHSIDANGVEHMQMLATHIGTDHAGSVTDTIVHNNQINHIKFDLPGETEIEPPIPVPIVPRRPMEQAENKKDKGREQKAGGQDKIKNTAVKDVTAADGKVKSVDNGIGNVVDSISKSKQEANKKRKDIIFKEFEDFVAKNPNAKIPQDLEDRYRQAEREDELDKEIDLATSKERELFKEFEDFEVNNPNEKIPQDLEDRYRESEENLSKAIKDREDFDKEIEDLKESLKNKGLSEVNDEEYNKFVDENLVTDERLNQITDKVINQKEMSSREQAIFAARTSEINEKIRKIAEEATPVVSNTNTNESAESEQDKITREGLDQDQKDLEDKVQKAEKEQKRLQKKVEGIIKKQFDKPNPKIPPSTQKKLEDANLDLEKSKKELQDFIETRKDLENGK